SIEVTKDGTTLSKEGDPITYAFTITNTSSFDTPDLVLDSVMDVGNGWAGLGDLTATAAANGCGTLAPETSEGQGDEESCSFEVIIAAPAGPKPLENTVTVHYHPGPDFDNDIEASDGHSVD
ncbi:MAG: hypothetical protein GTN78_15430, partial [Gemmatimonadales bacterium]|nr:hypothetical protein [Gemmatimonadales bacterium]NIR01566.1 hypothetical protein [Gemmatimonadales bacterium]